MIIGDRERKEAREWADFITRTNTGGRNEFWILQYMEGSWKTLGIK